MSPQPLIGRHRPAGDVEQQGVRQAGDGPDAAVAVAALALHDQAAGRAVGLHARGVGAAGRRAADQLIGPGIDGSRPRSGLDQREQLGAGDRIAAQGARRVGGGVVGGGVGQRRLDGSQSPGAREVDAHGRAGIGRAVGPDGGAGRGAVGGQQAVEQLGSGPEHGVQIARVGLVAEGEEAVGDRAGQGQLAAGAHRQLAGLAQHAAADAVGHLGVAGQHGGLGPRLDGVGTGDRLRRGHQSGRHRAGDIDHARAQVPVRGQRHGPGIVELHARPGVEVGRRRQAAQVGVAAGDVEGLDEVDQGSGRVVGQEVGLAGGVDVERGDAADDLDAAELAAGGDRAQIEGLVALEHHAAGAGHRAGHGDLDALRAVRAAHRRPERHHAADVAGNVAVVGHAVQRHRDRAGGGVGGRNVDDRPLGQGDRSVAGDAELDLAALGLPGVARAVAAGPGQDGGPVLQGHAACAE